MSSISHQRNCNREKNFAPLAHQSKQICVFIESEKYHYILFDTVAFRQYLDGSSAQYPELFPVDIQQGYQLHAMLPESKKMPGMRRRRIVLHTGIDFTL